MTSVPDVAVADVLVVTAVGPEGPSLWAVESFETVPRPALDLTGPLADVTLAGPGRLLVQGPRAEQALRSPCSSARVCSRATSSDWRSSASRRWSST